MLKKFLIGTLAVLAIGFALTASAADFGSTTLKVGSKGDAVKAVQTLVGASVDGSFGPMTKAKVMAWQASNGLTADGVFGAKSKEKANAGSTTSTVAGCPAGALFNSMTGASCTATASTVAGCAVGAAFSSTTGASCTGAAAVVTSTGEGSLAVTYDAIPANNLAVNRGASASVMAIKLKATGSDMKVSRVWLDINTRIWLSASQVDLLDGSTVLATLPLSASTVNEVTAGSSYQLQFNGLNVTVAKDTTKVLTFKVTRPTLTNADSSVTVAATSTVRATDGAGISNTYVLPSGRTWNMAAVAASTGTLTATLAATSPANQAITGLSITSGATTDVKLMDFNLKATDGPINITRIQGTMASTGTLINDVASVELRDGTTVIATDASATVDGTPDFSSLNIDVAVGTTPKVLSIWAKVNPVLTGNVVAGDTVSAVVNSITATTGTSFASASITDTVTGNGQVLYADGINVSLVSKSATPITSPDTATVTDRGTYVINFDVTAVGADMYLDKTSTLDIIAGGVDAAAGQGVLFDIYKNGTAVDQAVANFATGPSSVLSVDGSTVGTVDNLTNKFKITEGETRHFHLTVTLGLDATGTNGDGFYKVGLPSINWTSVATDNDSSANFYTFGLSNFVTADLNLSDYAL